MIVVPCGELAGQPAAAAGRATRGGRPAKRWAAPPGRACLISYVPEPGPRDEQRALRVEEHAPYVLCHHMSQAGDLAMSSGHCVSRCAHLCHISASRDLAMSNEPLAPIEKRPPYALLTSSMCW